MFHTPIGRFQLELIIFIANFSTVVPFNSCVSFPVGFSSSMRHFQKSCRVLKFILSPDLGSWLLEFKSLIILIVGSRLLDLNSKINSPDQATKYISCTDGKISVRIINFYYLFFTVVPLTSCVFFTVSLWSLTWRFQQVL